MFTDADMEFSNLKQTPEFVSQQADLKKKSQEAEKKRKLIDDGVNSNEACTLERSDGTCSHSPSENRKLQQVTADQ